MNPADPETIPDPIYVGVVTITHGDQLRAELEGKRHGLESMKDAPLHYTTIWVWAAMVRTGDYADKFGAFKAHGLAELQPVEQEGGDQEADPTNPAPSTGSA
jgi:hypothetical protein